MKLKNQTIKVWQALIIMVVAIICTISITQFINNSKAMTEVMYDVVAENEEFYVLQDCNNTEHYTMIDKSEMYGVGETVVCYYDKNEIISVWLYVDC